MSGPDDERLHRGEGDLLDDVAIADEPMAPEIAPPPVSNSEIAGRAAQVRAQRGKTGDSETQEEAERDHRRQFTGSIPPPPDPGSGRTLTTADEPADPADSPPSSPPTDDDDAGPTAGSGSWTSTLSAPPPPPPATSPPPDPDSWIRQNDGGNDETAAHPAFPAFDRVTTE